MKRELMLGVIGLITVMGIGNARVEASSLRPVSTFSIVARDSVTGQMGVAVQSHWFSVGPVVPWAEAGVGAIATQSFVKIEYGPDGLDRLRSGESPQQALAAMLAADSGREVRQVAIVDAKGNVATHTGAKCVAYASHITGPGFSVQANLMADSTVPKAMAKAYTEAKGPLGKRLLAALRAAEHEGGDIRGRQSAAIVIVDGQRHDKPWQGKVVELRVEDNPDPVAELVRVYRLNEAYDWMNRGDGYSEKKDWDSASMAYGAAEKIAPQILELPFWHATTLANAGRVDEALPIFSRVFAKQHRWLELVPRLVPAGLLPNDSTVINRILRAAPAQRDSTQ